MNMKELKMMEWNINGRTGFGGNYCLPITILIDQIQMENPDVCVLVEFTKSCGYLDFEYILNEMGYDLFATDYMKDWNGVAIVVKKEFNPVLVEQRTDMICAEKWPDYLRVDAEIDGNMFSIIGTRIRTISEFTKRKEQLDLLINHLEEINNDFAVLGDFNNGNINCECDREYAEYDRERKYYNYQMIWRNVEDNHNWTFVTPNQGEGYESSHSIVTEYKGNRTHTKDDHMITSLEKETIVSAKYDWHFVNVKNGYYNCDMNSVLSKKIGKPDHAVLLIELEMSNG